VSYGEVVSWSTVDRPWEGDRSLSALQGMGGHRGCTGRKRVVSWSLQWTTLGGEAMDEDLQRWGMVVAGGAQWDECLQGEESN
jgi:hypothetical protein